MTTGEFADLVGRMRRAQELAVKTKTPEAWLEKARLEREVDGILLDRIRRNTARTAPELDFGEGGVDDTKRIDNQKTIPGGRDTTDPSPHGDAAAWHDQQGACAPGQPTGEESQQFDIW